MRIGKLLRAREQELVDHTNLGVEGPGQPDHPPSSTGDNPSRPLRVFIHTSPYQRCVQTSVAITAGLAQYRTLAGNTHGRSPSTHSPSKSVDCSASPTSQPVDRLPSPSPLISSCRTDLAHNQEAASRAALPNITTVTPPSHPNAILRVDACLGEWLSPEYSILPKSPPESDALVAAAKAELSRPSDAIQSFSPIIAAPQGSLWGSNYDSHAYTPDSLSIKSPRKLGPNPRSISSAVSANTTNARWSTELDQSHSYRHVSNPTPSLITQFAPGYQVPTPAYAILPTEPIPKGFVAHARDACTDVDFEWDSLLPPLTWGNGGDYGEEWSALHKRFRCALNHIINYYTSDHLNNGFSTSHDRLYGHRQDDETAIVIVTHSAGCNALIAALTDQPVLLDVGVGSLTMAVRNRDPILTESVLPHQLPLSTLYDMKIVASVDHLRSSANTDGTLATALTSQKSIATSIPGLNRRNTVITSNLSSSLPDGHWPVQPSTRRRSVNVALDSVRRPCTSPVFSHRSDSLTSVSSSNGLWTPIGALPTTDYDEQVDSSPLFSLPRPGHPAREGDVVTQLARPGFSPITDEFESSVTSDATICGPNRANSMRPCLARSLNSSASMIRITSPNMGLPVSTFPVAISRTSDGAASPQASVAVTTASPPDLAAPNNREQASRHDEGSSSGVNTPTLSRAFPRPQDMPDQPLKRQPSQKGLWGSAPVNVLEARSYGIGKPS